MERESGLFGGGREGKGEGVVVHTMWIMLVVAPLFLLGRGWGSTW